MVRKMEYFYRYKNDNNLEKGDLLLAEPFMGDPNFQRSVILICEINDIVGCFGVILNKKTTLRHVVMDELTNTSKRCMLYEGGPVDQQSLLFIHRLGNIIPGGYALRDELWVGGNFHQLEQLIQHNEIKDEDYKLVLGYAGWSYEQLKTELQENSWIVCRSPPISLIFEEKPDLLWKKILFRMGSPFSMYANYPLDPNLN